MSKMWYTDDDGIDHEVFDYIVQLEAKLKDISLKYCDAQTEIDELRDELSEVRDAEPSL